MCGFFQHYYQQAKLLFENKVNNIFQGLNISPIQNMWSSDGSRYKGREFEPRRWYTWWKWCQSHTGLINTPSLNLLR